MDHFQDDRSPATLLAQDTDADKTLRKLRAANYPNYAIYVVVCIIFVACLYNVATVVCDRLFFRSTTRINCFRNSEVTDKEANSSSTPRSGKISLRRIPLALLNATRKVACRTTIWFGPSMRFPLIEAATCCAYFLVLLLFDFVNTHNLAGSPLDPHYWANRAATLAISQFSIIIALSAKNNIISLLTGISYEKLNIFHRAGSRVVLILIWVHMWGRWKLGFTGDDVLTLGWLRSGIVANAALTLMVILGARPIRDWGYEFFIVSHIVLSIIILVAGTIHVTNAREFLPYVWSACIFWGLDRTIRLLRVLRIRYLGIDTTVVALSYDTVRVSLRISPSTHPMLFRLRWRPGQSAYLSVPSLSYCQLPFWTEAHPFTIASIDVPSASDTTIEDNGSTERREGERILEIAFMIRVRQGFTRRLHERAVRAGGTCTVSAYLDGPYGDPPVVHSFSDVILVAGGSGVSFTLPLLLDLIRRSQADVSTVRCGKVVFILYVRDRVHFEGISNEIGAIQRNVPQTLEVEIRVFITGGLAVDGRLGVPSLEAKEVKSGKNETMDDSVIVSTKNSGIVTPANSDEKQTPGSEPGTNATMRVEYGRPAVGDLLKTEIATTCGDSVAVCVSGPQTLIDDVRSALNKPSIAGPVGILRGEPSVFLHVEHFGM